MTTSRKLTTPLILSLATLGFVGVSASIGLFNYIRWYLQLPDIPIGLPPSFWWSFAKTAIQSSACIAAFVVILYARSRRTALVGALAAVGLLVALLLVGWPSVHQRVLAGEVSLLAGHGLRAVFVAWLSGLGAALLSNYAFERTAGRGLDVS